jgi:putative transposase
MGLRERSYIGLQPSWKPSDNAYAEGFNSTVGLECLGQHWFLDLDDAREKGENWRRGYNEVRL